MMHFAHGPGIFKLSLQTGENVQGETCVTVIILNSYHKTRQKHLKVQASFNSLLIFGRRSGAKPTDRVQVLHDVLEGWVSPELLKELPLVEQRVHQVGVVV